MNQQTADFGLIGLAVMGQNLVLNMADHGYQIAVFNRTAAKVEEFLQGPAKGKKVQGAHTIEELISQLKRPRKVMLMVKAGAPVDELIDHIAPLLEPGDIIIDGGNSHFPDSQRRYEALKEKKILFLGAGISGGEEGARHGPSIMPGGNPDAWKEVKELLQAISAKSEEGEPCCDWVGEGGAGHYVKMVHNGIEYGDMQLICEAYDLLHRGAGIPLEELHNIFTEWNKTELDSYLIEITSQIFTKKEEKNQKQFLLENILDVAGQKGTGKWTVMDALEKGMPVTLIAEAVFARNLSSLKEERVELSKTFSEEKKTLSLDKKAFIEKVRKGLYTAKMLSYTQGFMLMRKASEELKWNLNYGSIALMWRGGCIIRSKFLGKIKEAFTKNKELKSLLLDDYFHKEIQNSVEGLRESIRQGVSLGIPLPCFSAALAFFDGYRSEKLPANLIQAQRDFFGAHTYERIHQPRGKFFHTNWTGTGGDVSSSSYNA